MEASDTVNALVPDEPDMPPAKKGGRERRQHGRWKVTGAYVQVGEDRFPLVDISMGGFQMRGDNHGAFGAGVFTGSIIWPDGGRNGTVDFKARAVRTEPGSEMIGAAFQPMEGEQIDQLLAMLSAIEGRWRHDRERAERSVILRRRLRRLVASVSLIGILGGLGWVAWVLKPILF